MIFLFSKLSNKKQLLLNVEETFLFKVFKIKNIFFFFVKGDRQTSQLMIKMKIIGEINPYSNFLILLYKTKPDDEKTDQTKCRNSTKRTNSRSYQI